MANSPVTHPSLLLRIRDASDDRAWSQFVEVYAPLIYGYGRKRGLQDHDAADLTQDALGVVARAARRLDYDPARGSFRGWLFTIVRRKLLNHLASRLRQPEGTGFKRILCGNCGVLRLLSGVSFSFRPSRRGFAILASISLFGNYSPILSRMSEVTRILSAIEQGDSQAAEQLLPLVYDELRKLAAARLAAEAPGQTLQATALVHEAYLRLVGSDKSHDWHGRGHFFAAAAEAMRRILIESARRRKSAKGGGGWQRQEIIDADLAVNTSGDDLFAVDEALTRLGIEDPRAARLVELRFFLGMTLEEAAAHLGMQARTAYRDWAYARAWLRRALDDAK
jgi:RNA polymerase sigma factor (TIGR02999 family)